MPRRISFYMTPVQFLDGSKDVTRRLGWGSLKAGDKLTGVRKCMGLKKGETQEVFGDLEVLSVRREPLSAITDDDVDREGFPGKGCAWFIEKFCRSMRCDPDTEVTRIEFRRTPAPTEQHPPECSFLGDQPHDAADCWLSELEKIPGYKYRAERLEDCPISRDA